MYYGTHNNTILASLNSDRKDSDSFCDVTLEVEGKTFPAHKCILGKLSPFFNKMFKTKMKEKFSSKASVQGVSSELMKIVLEFLYTAAVNIHEDNVYELMRASDYFQLDELRNLCASFLVDTVDATNCLHHIEMGQTFNCEHLTDNAVEVAAVNFEEVIEQVPFKDLDKNTLLRVMKSVDQMEVTGQVMYGSVATWVKHKCEDRKQHFVEFLKIIDFESLPVSFMQWILAEEVLLKESHECKDYFLNLLFKRVHASEDEFNKETDLVPTSSQMTETLYPWGCRTNFHGGGW